MRKRGFIFFCYLIFQFHSSCKNINADAQKLLTLLPNQNSPKILSAVPGMGDKGLPKTQKIVILFDRAMNINSCVQSFSTSPSVSGYFDLTDYSLTFTPTVLWNLGTYSYTLTKNCESKDGNDLESIHTASFSVGDPMTAGSFPEVSSVTVGVGSIVECDEGQVIQKDILDEELTNVCMGSPKVNPIVFNFSRAMDKTSTNAALIFSPPISYRSQWVSDSQLKILPDLPFIHRSRISFNLSTSAKDMLGMSILIPIAGSFFVGTGNLVPILTRLDGMVGSLSDCSQGSATLTDLKNQNITNVCIGNPNSNTFTFHFSKSMQDARTQSSITFFPSLSGRYEWSTDRKVLSFLTDLKLTYGTRYSIVLGSGAISEDGIFIESTSTHSFTAGGSVSNAPQVQAIGVATQGCASSLPGSGNPLGANWLSNTCFWDNSLPILNPSAYRFRAGDSGNGNLHLTTDCADVESDNFRIIFSNFMEMNSTVNAIRLRRLSPPSSVIQLSKWNWDDCQSSPPFGCRVINLAFAELEASCNGTSSFGNGTTGGDFNLQRSDHTLAGFPYYMISVDVSAKDINQVPLSQPFQFSMEAK